MTAVLAESVKRRLPEPTADRQKLVELTDHRTTELVESILDNRIDPDWAAMLKSIDAVTPAVRDRMLRQVQDAIQNQSAGFSRRLAAVMIHGGFLSLWQGRRIGLPILNGGGSAQFATAAEAYTPEAAVLYWKEELELSNAVVRQFLETITAAGITEITLEYARVIISKVDALFATALAEGWSLSTFRKAFETILPDASKTLTETLYRTEMARAFGRKMLDLLRASSQFVPLIQYITVGDDRVRENHEAMHGYVAANADPIWDVWVPPNGFRCRCVLSPITFLEAVRRGWAKRENGVIVLTRGPRPVGPPPKVDPDPGF